jgi:hypothetical protein
MRKKFQVDLLGVLQVIDGKSSDFLSLNFLFMCFILILLKIQEGTIRQHEKPAILLLKTKDKMQSYDELEQQMDIWRK